MSDTIAVANKLPPTAVVSGWNGVIVDLLGVGVSRDEGERARRR